MLKVLGRKREGIALLSWWNAKDGRSAQAASGRKAWVRWEVTLTHSVGTEGMGVMGGDTHGQPSLWTEGNAVWSWWNAKDGRSAR